MSDDSQATPDLDERRWYEGITRYQWIVLVIASLGWVFDIFEGQIFVASMNEAMPSLVPAGRPTAFYNNFALGAFLLGGAIGGILFGMLSDRIGRKKTLSLTILFYSFFTCLSAFSMAWWHLAGFRFLVAMGVGGEWAVASSLVAEVFPQRARARVGGIFHASSVFGTYLATAAGYFIVGNPLFRSEAHPSLPWRIGFVVGVLPAVLILWIRRSLKEPQSWQQARDAAAADASKQMGRLSELFQGPLLRRTVVGVTLASVGLATFWGAHIFGKDLMRRDAMPYYVPVANSYVEVNSATRADCLRKLQDDARRSAESEAAASSLDLPPEQMEELFGAASSLFEDTDFMRAELALERSTETGGAVEVVAYHPKPNDRIPPDAAEDDRAARFDRSVLRQFSEEKPAEFFFSSMVSMKNRINQKLKLWEMFGMLLATTGGGLGLLFFGPLCEWIGRKPAFLFFHLGGLIIALLTFQFVHGWAMLLVVLPVFGFLTLGMHAGYAIYFPELYPTRLRGTGGGFCFNAGRISVPPILIVSGLLQDSGLSPENAYSILSLLYLVGMAALIFAPETKGQPLPE